MLRTRATGLLSGRQMTASPISSAPVATTNCSDEPFAASSGWWLLLASATAAATEVAPCSRGCIFWQAPRYLCTSGKWGSARQITRPLSHSSGVFAEASGDGSHLAYRSAYGNRSSGACLVARRGGSRLMPHSHPCLSCIRYDKTRHTGMLTKPVPNHRDLDEASACARAPLCRGPACRPAG